MFYVHYILYKLNIQIFIYLLRGCIAELWFK